VPKQRRIDSIKLTPPLFIKVSVPNQECEQSCIHVCVLGGIDVASVSAPLRSDFGTVPTEWYFYGFPHFIISLRWHNLVRNNEYWWCLYYFSVRFCSECGIFVYHFISQSLFHQHNVPWRKLSRICSSPWMLYVRMK